MKDHERVAEHYDTTDTSDLIEDAEWVGSPERTWTPGDGPVLPPLPEECYPPDAVPLPEQAP